MDKLKSGAEFSFQDVKKLFDVFNDMDEAFGECFSIFMELTSHCPEKYEEESKAFRNAEMILNTLRQDSGAIMFSIAGQLENYKRAYPDAFKKTR